MTEREQARYRASHGEGQARKERVARQPRGVHQVRAAARRLPRAARRRTRLVTVFPESARAAAARSVHWRPREGGAADSFEFNSKTPPVKRHKLIKDFQDEGGKAKKGAKVFVVTYATAAVGITLTAANRVYLMEPALDPSQELQAAGRIHRLGQTKEVFIFRYAFRSTVEEAVLAFHEKVKSGELTTSTAASRGGCGALP